jgi:phosphate transport system substrate-binding protein
MSPFTISSHALGSCKPLLAAFVLIVCCTTPAFAQVQGAGSSLARSLMTAWADQYGGAVGGVSYEAVGSSAGVSRATEQTVDFGVTDVAITGVALKQAGLKQLPLAATAVAVVVNLPELAGKPLRLNADILADIYQGAITHWNHSQIAGNNPGLALPARAIVPLWRADGSGQSHVFSTYLSRGNAKWRRVVSSTSNLQLPVGKGVRGGQALIDALKATPGGIAYESLTGARASGLPIAELQNASSKYVGPSAGSVAEALAAANWAADNNAADLDGSAGAGAYPMSAITYALIPAAPKAARKPANAFFAQALSLGDAAVQKAGFNVLPAAGKTMALAAAR